MRRLLWILTATAAAACSPDPALPADAPDASEPADAAGLGPDAGRPTPEVGLCNTDGWCWENPNPQGNLLHLWSASRTDAWAAGGAGVMLHWDGSAWAQVPVATSDDFTAIWGSGPSDVWAFTQPGIAWHFDGHTWSAATTKQVLLEAAQISGTGLNDVWAVGEWGDIAHWNGSAWSSISIVPPNVTVVDDYTLHGVAAVAPNDVWAVGGAYSIRHYDGTSWKLIQSYPGSYSGYLSAWANGPNDVWIGSESGVSRWDGTSWKSMATSDYRWGGTLWGSGPDDMVSVGRFGTVDIWDGARWSDTSIDLFVTMLSVHGSARDDVWVAGTGGALAHFDGTSWTKHYASVTADSLRQCVASSPTDAWALGVDDSYYGDVLHFDGVRWSRTAVPSGRWRQLWANGPDDAWAAADNTTDLAHWDGAAWTTVKGPTTYGYYVSGFWGSGRDDVYAKDGKAIYHWDGAAWSLSKDWPAGALCGASKDSVWALSWQLPSYHWNGQTWEEKPASPVSDSCWVAPNGDVWAIGTDDVVRFDGTSWTTVVHSGLEHFQGVWGRAANDVYAVAWEGDLWHWDGAAMTKVAKPTGYDLEAICGSGDTLWAVGAWGTILTKWQ